ncbi:S8 family peptidase [Cohnella cellulosilytica]|uniref:S8 family peptidase n=1 Tax=Cohnella cellulosilytica TaxID=986710 RepID=A0ABW2F4M2_9BACL
MNLLAKQLCAALKRKRPASRAERRNIVFRRAQDYRACLKQLSAEGIRPLKQVDSMRMICCHGDKSAGWKQLSSHPRIALVERDRKVKAHGLGRVALPGLSAVVKSRITWNVNRVKAPPAWPAANFGAAIKIAILDTGIARHPDLAIAGGVNTITGKSYADDNGHGTHVAGIAAATGRKRIYGVAPKVELYAVKVLDENGSGFISDIVEGIDWCLSRGIRILNMSFGLSADSALLRNAIRQARRRGAVIVASAGNSGTALPQIDAPARYPETIAVAATTRANRPASFSSRGRGIDIAAPGVSILSTWPGGTYRRESGTSMSAPHVTGAAALLRGVRPKLSATEVARRLKKAALAIPGGKRAVGSGLLQIEPATR